ncbi:hypothetical protein AB6A40_002421 [Gnathostoma spinigerum]|uniref:Fas-binding factor 1 C-terminal domain-containing protein n=1 Tax=Gnathostoma spinigerum TaxID=75299 RepID=A0ABD6EGN2_9BILA
MDDSDSDGVGSLLADVNGLDDELFGKKKIPETKTTSIRNSGKMESFFGSAKQPGVVGNASCFTSSTACKPVISFLDEQQKVSEPSAAEATRPTFETRTSFNRGTNNASLEDAKSDSISFDKRIPVRSNERSPFLEDTKRGKETMEVNFTLPTTGAALADESYIHFADERVKRLNAEIDRLTREMDKMRRDRRESEEEIIREWKQKLMRKQQESDETIEELRKQHSKQIQQLTEEHSLIISKMKSYYEQHFQAMTDVQKQTCNYDEIIQKLQSLSNRMETTTSDIGSLADKNLIERETTLAVREQRVEIREQRLEEDERSQCEEKEQIKKLMAKLQSIYEQSEAAIIKERWKLEEERNELCDEKKQFKADQKYVLEIIEQKLNETEAARAEFLQQQHDLLARVLMEREAIESEKDTFYSKRNSDIFRLKSEAELLDQRMHKISVVETLMLNSQRIFDNKNRKLVALEQALTDECFELERYRRSIEQNGGNLRTMRSQVQLNEQENGNEWLEISTGSMGIESDFYDKRSSKNAGHPVVDPYTEEYRNDLWVIIYLPFGFPKQPTHGLAFHL